MAITFRAAGTVVTGDQAASLTLTAPAGTVSSDIVLAVWMFGGGTNVGITPPAGWTLAVRIDDAVSSGLAVYWGLGSATFGAWAFSGGVNLGATVGWTLGYIGVDNTTPMDATAVGQTNALSTTVTSPSITTVSANAWIAGFFGWYDSGGGAAPTWTAQFGTFRQSGSLVGAAIPDTVAADSADTPQAVAGASGTKTATASIAPPVGGSDIGITVALRPAIVSVSPFKNSALAMVQNGFGGRPARRRAGYFYIISDQVNTISAIIAAAVPQTNIAQPLTQAGIGGRASRRRDSRYIQSSNETKTIFQDQAISLPKDRTNRHTVSRFRNWDAPQGNFLVNLFVAVINPIKNLAEVLYQVGSRRTRRRTPAWYTPIYWNSGVTIAARGPFRNFALAMVQVGQGGKRARNRAGFWHTIADKINTVLSGGAETPQVNIAQNIIQAGTGGRASRRRDSRYIATANQTQTTFQDQVISLVNDRNNRQSVSRFKNWDIPSLLTNLLVTVVTAFNPFSNSARLLRIIQSTKRIKSRGPNV